MQTLGGEIMNNVEKMLSAYEAQTEKATNEKEVVAESCCEACCDSCICFAWFAEGGCC